MSTGGIILQWMDRNFAENGHKIYRSDTPMSLGSMPSPIATLEKNDTKFTDYDVTEGKTYYYRVGAIRGNDIAISDELEMVAEELVIGPDSNVELIGGDMDYGFFGEVSTSEFITGDDLASKIGLTAGTSQYSDEPWLKFIYKGELIYVSKKSLRYDLSWEDIYQVGAVYGSDDFGTNPSGGDKLQDAKVMIGNYEFKVTLLKGANDGVDPTPNDTGWDLDWTHNSEWNKLMYPIHSGVHTRADNPDVGSVPFNQWASYSDEDLLVHYDYGDGTYCWTQETHGYSNSYRLHRGGRGVTYVLRSTSSNSNTNIGWRVALRSSL